MGRIVNGRKFTRVELSERTAWALVPVDTGKGGNGGSTFPPLPPASAPPSVQPATDTEEDADADLTW